MKIIKISFFIFATILLIFIPLALYLIRFNNTSDTGKFLKSKILKYPEIINLINLDEPGDGKYIYVSPKSNKLTVKTYSVNKYVPDENVGVWIKEIMSESLGKEAVVYDTVEIGYEGNGMLSNDDINIIREKVSEENGIPADLNIIYAGKYTVKPSSLGLVLHRDTVFIFKDAIAQMSEKGYINDVLEKTTIMHEWGHLLGLDHFEADHCIMSEKVEVFDNPPAGKSLPKNYCWEELNEINELKKDI